MGVYGPVTTDTGVGTCDGIGGPNIVGNGGYRMYGCLTFEPDKTLSSLFLRNRESGICLELANHSIEHTVSSNEKDMNQTGIQYESVRNQGHHVCPCSPNFALDS